MTRPFDWDADVGSITPKQARQECIERSITYQDWAQETADMYPFLFDCDPPPSLVPAIVNTLLQDEAWWTK